MVQIQVHAGGAYEGHVVYVAHNPTNGERELFSDLDAVSRFCTKHDLRMDNAFEQLVLEKLVFSHANQKLIIPPSKLREESPVSSAQEFLRNNFPKYY